MDQKVFSFNAYKHHLQFVREIIFPHSENKSKQNFNTILSEIKQIGNNTMDLYSGSMSVESIFENLISIFNELRMKNKNDYLSWLGRSGYKIIDLSDKSVWIARLGDNGDTFVHIHPARTGSHVIRITGSAWKTALATILFKNLIPEEHIELKARINYIRTHLLDLSLVKRVIPDSSLDLAFKLLNS
jgi:hypothetical protein